VAFIDGKHSTDVVAAEGRLLAGRQDRGDLAVFDDVQIPAVGQAIKTLGSQYEFTVISLSHVPRTYAVGVRL
jgi:predicted nucleotidyltransferase